MREEVTKYLDGNPTPHPEDIAEWVETVFDQEFNLILEDNSVDAICNDLYKGTTYLKERKEQELLVLWNKIPNKSNIQAQATAQSEESSSDEDGEGNDEDEPMEEDGDQRGPRRQPRMVTDEDGWTTVQKRWLTCVLLIIALLRCWFWRSFILFVGIDYWLFARFLSFPFVDYC